MLYAIALEAHNRAWWKTRKMFLTKSSWPPHWFNYCLIISHVLLSTYRNVEFLKFFGKSKILIWKKEIESFIFFTLSNS